MTRDTDWRGKVRVWANNSINYGAVVYFGCKSGAGIGQIHVSKSSKLFLRPIREFFSKDPIREVIQSLWILVTALFTPASNWKCPRIKLIATHLQDGVFCSYNKNFMFCKIFGTTKHIWYKVKWGKWRI